MKAGLITFHYAHHYGAQLQAYALMRSIEELGVQCEIINYVRPDTHEGNELFKKNLSLRSMAGNLHTLLHYSAFKRRQTRFSSFVNSEMKLSRESYTTYEALSKNPPSYNMYVCGSDQVWNPLIFAEKDFDASFFMPFAGERKKIAYAPSFGISTIPDNKKEKLKNYLSGFSFLSTREPQGVEIIRDISGMDSQVVLDPTLLLTENQWNDICTDASSEPYMLCYFVTDPSPYFQYIQSLADMIKLPIVCLCGSRKVIPGSSKVVYDAGPREFLSLFKNASFVCTNSFHGSVFSIIFKRDFYCFKNSYNFSSEGGSVKTVNSRLHSLLETLGLKDRLFSDKLANIQKNIDYNQVTPRLDAEREKSLSYLRKALYNE